MGQYFQVVEKYLSITQQNNIPSSTKPHLTDLTIPQNLLSTSGHSYYFPHNDYYNSGNLTHWVLVTVILILITILKIKMLSFIFLYLKKMFLFK